MSLPTSPLRLLPTAATFVGWDSHPLKFRAFSRRTMDKQDGQDKNQKARQRHEKTNIETTKDTKKREKKNTRKTEEHVKGARERVTAVSGSTIDRTSSQRPP